MLARAIGQRGRITGVDVSPAALLTARQRSRGTGYEGMVQYRLGMLEAPPVPPGSCDIIFSANVSQYLPDTVATFAAMGHFLAQGGRLAIKDIDFGTMCFSNIDAVLQARADRERVRAYEGFAFEDSWIGSKLAGLLRTAGYEEVVERSYRITRHYPISGDVRRYLQAIAEWFISEGAPFLEKAQRQQWLLQFRDGRHYVFDQPTFASEKTEFVVTCEWSRLPRTPARRAGLAASDLPTASIGGRGANSCAPAGG